MHKNAQLFCQLVKKYFPQYFTCVNVLDCGCLDINGNNRYLFESSNYIGLDIVDGPNVDFVTKIHQFTAGSIFDVVISTEMLEHDKDYLLSLRSMFGFTRSGGLLLLTAAGTGRKEHGTSRRAPASSPLTNDYYRNITVAMILQALDLDLFSWYEISYITGDIRFAGIKK